MHYVMLLYYFVSADIAITFIMMVWVCVWVSGCVGVYTMLSW